MGFTWRNEPDYTTPISATNLNAAFAEKRNVADPIPDADLPVTAQAATLDATYASYPAVVGETGAVNLRYPHGDVRRFGAVGDWNGATGTDNLAAFNAAAATLLLAGGPTRLIVPAPGDYWLSDSWNLDGEDVELEVQMGAVVRTTTATSSGHTIAFIGHGILSPDNTVATPQRHRFRAFGGGSVVSVNAADNAIGAVRVQNADFSCLTLTSGQHGATCQYGVDSVLMEHLEVTSGGSGIYTYGACHRVAVRDAHIISAAKGVNVDGPAAAATDPTLWAQDVSLENVMVDSSTGHSASVAYAKRVRVTGGNLAGTQGLYLTYVTGYQIDGATIPAGTTLGTSVSPTLPDAVELTLGGGWSAFGTPYATPAVRRDSDGFGHLEGAIKSGTLTSGTVIATVPLGFRPRTQVRFSIQAAGPTSGQIDIFINTAGQITLSATVPSTVVISSLDGVIFPLAST